MRGPARVALLLAWIAALAAGALLTARTLEVGTDLRLFMPAAQTPPQRLLLDQVGEGPGSRLLLIALAGAPPEALAESSQALLAALRDDPAFRFAANGDDSAAAVPELLLAYRYLLTPSFDARALDASLLREQLAERAADLASPAAMLLEDWLPRDPTLETLVLAERWRPAAEPERELDVWFSRDRTRALLVAETAAAGFDPDAQRAALDRLQQAFAHARATPAVTLEVRAAPVRSRR